MEKEFCTYTQALRLKALGFDEPCWCYFMGDVFNSSMFLKDYEYLDTMPQKYITYTLAPLRQQAFRWFRDNGYCRPSYIPLTIARFLSINNMGYEEAELACLDKLLEIVESESE